MKRRRTKRVYIGAVPVGGGAPVSIQSMTKTRTADIRATAREITRLAKAGCDIIRVAVRDTHDSAGLAAVVRRSPLPVVADIHFLSRLAHEAIDAGVAAVRLNPGNISRRKDVLPILDHARARRIPIRIGINAGSLAPSRGRPASRMVRSALASLALCEEAGFRDCIVSLKSHSVTETVEAYREMGRRCRYPFHLGITAAGPLSSAVIRSSVGIGTLLLEGLGDTIRVSVTGDPLDEVRIGKEILAAAGMRREGIQIISCPTCGRCDLDLRSMVHEFESALKKRPALADGRTLKVALMGCVVNGPGEAREADIGIACGPREGVLFCKGRRVARVPASRCVKELIGSIMKLRKEPGISLCLCITV